MGRYQHWDKLNSIDGKTTWMTKVTWKMDYFVIETHGDGPSYIFCSQPAGVLYLWLLIFRR